MIWNKVFSVAQKLRTTNVLKFSAAFQTFSKERFFSTTSAVRNIGYLDNHYNKYSILPNIKDKVLVDKPDMTYTKIDDDKLLSKAKRDQFLSYYPEIANELENKASSIDHIKRGAHLRRVLDYITEGGNKYGGIVVAETYKMLTPDLTPEKLKLAYYLGWCLELLVDSIGVVDDITDSGKTRRHKPCWYLVEDVQMGAINDSFLIEKCVQYLMRTHFGHLDCFMRLQELFTESLFMFFLGQIDDGKFTQNIENITMKNYESITLTSTGYIISYLPVVLGMTLAGYTDPEIVKKAHPILSELGYFYLIENDYMDCFGTKITGKVRRDIQQGRCRWLAVACLENATPAQREIMKNHYGRDTPEDVAIIKQLYLDMNLPEIYAEYSKEVYNRLMKNVEENSYGDLKKVYLKLIETLTCSSTVGGLYP